MDGAQPSSVHCYLYMHARQCLVSMLNPAEEVLPLRWRHVHTTNGASAGVVDVCLIPEVPFALKGPKGLFAYVEKVLEERGHCVMCIAEGAGQVSRTASNPGLLSNLSVVFHCALAAVLQPPEA